MKKIVLNTKPTNLFRYYNGELYVRLDIQQELKDETKFKNSAFVKTGRKVPTGNYTALEDLVNVGSYAHIDWFKMQNIVNDSIDKFVKNEVLRGLVWKGFRVWLSEENQRNYASWVTAAKLSNNIFPLKAKFNDPKTKQVIYYEFSNISDLEDFYSTCIKHINNCVNKGRELKDEFVSNISLYKESFKSLF